MHEFAEKIKAVVEEAGYKIEEIQCFKNQYWNSVTANPWLHVKTDLGVLEIGERKHVIHLDWRLADGINVDGTLYFESEDVTKDKTLIHAWSRDKLVEYLRTLREFPRRDRAEYIAQKISTIRRERLQLEENFRKKCEELARDQFIFEDACTHKMNGATVLHVGTGERCPICDRQVW